MKKFYFSFLLICIFQINLVTTSAQLYWSETFGANTSNYTDGQNIAGVNKWDYQDAANTGYKAKIGTPLTYGNLLTDATYFIGGGSWQPVGVGISVAYQSPFFNAYNSDANWEQAGYKAGGSNEFWYSMLVRADQANDFSMGFHSNNIRWYINDSKMLVNRSNSGEWSIQMDGVTTTSGVTVGTGITVLLVCKINFEVDGTRLTLFVNPTPGTTPTGGVTGKTLTPKFFKSIAYYLSNDPNKFSIDELRIGATYADVTPVSGNVTGVEKNNVLKTLIYAQNGMIVADLSSVNGASVLSVIDSKGAVIKTVQSNGSEILKINVPNTGMFIVRLQNGDKQTTQKIVL